MSRIQSLDRPLAAVFVACREYYLANSEASPRQRRSEAYKLVQKALAASLKAMAALHAVKYPGYSADKDHPGYVIRLEPPMLFRVPYHVLPTFPTGPDLESLWQLSRVIRSGNRSVISISGSNVLRKIFDLVGDVDFCEYVPVDDPSGIDRMVANIDGNERVLCLKLALHDKKWASPWAEGKPSREYLLNTLDSSDKIDPL
jgi:hypothetical protein